MAVDLIPFYMIGGLIAAGLLIALGAAYHEKKRTEKLRAVAEELNLPFFATGDGSLVTRLNHFDLFAHGRSKKIKNMFHGQSDDVEIGIFDYRYTTGGGKNSNTYKQTVAYFRSAALRLPPFALRPEHFFHKLGGLFGYHDIDFESHPLFSKNYLLRGPNEHHIRAVFHEGILTHLEGQKNISLEANADELIYYRANKRVDPQKVRSFLEEAFALYSLFKHSGETEGQP